MWFVDLSFGSTDYTRLSTVYLRIRKVLSLSIFSAMAAETRLISVVHSNAIRHIAVYSNMEPTELSDLLCAVFSLSRNSVIGFASEESNLILMKII